MLRFKLHHVSERGPLFGSHSSYTEDTASVPVNIWRPEKNGCHFADNKFRYFHTRKCIWNYHLRNLDHFASASMCWWQTAASRQSQTGLQYLCIRSQLIQRTHLKLLPTTICEKTWHVKANLRSVAGPIINIVWHHTQYVHAHAKHMGKGNGSPWKPHHDFHYNIRCE